jgi:hypothetical protein
MGANKNENRTSVRPPIGDSVMSAITFDDEVHWDGDDLTFWANRGTERIRCQIGRKSINGLPGFTNATSQEIGIRKVELAELIKPNASRMILAGKYNRDLIIKTVQVYWEERADA